MFRQTAARIAGNRRIAPAEFPAGMRRCASVRDYSKGAGIERIECGHAINDDEPVTVELQLHQQLFAKGVDEVGGIGSAAQWQISTRARPSAAKPTSCSWVSKRSNTARSASSIWPVRKSSVRRCASPMVSMPPIHSIDILQIFSRPDRPSVKRRRRKCRLPFFR
jgi:hypothetical protein